MQDGLVETHVRHQLLDFPVLFSERSQLVELRGPELPELRQPVEKCLLRHLELAADLHERRAGFGLPERVGDLLGAEFAGPHLLSSSAPARGAWPASTLPPFCKSGWIRMLGADYHFSMTSDRCEGELHLGILYYNDQLLAPSTIDGGRRVLNFVLRCAPRATYRLAV